MTPDEMAGMLAKLQSEVRGLSDTGRDKRVAELVDERIAAWEKKRAALVLVILALFGLASYVSLNDKITTYFAQSVSLKIDDEVKTKTALISTQDPQIADLATKLDDLTKAITAVGSTVDKIAKADTPTVQVSGPIADPVNKGYAFFGIKAHSGGWSERHFQIKDATDRPPKADDIIVATGSVNIRRGYITYTDNGWVNQPTTGTAKKGDVFRVDEAREVTNGFWWVSLIRERK